MEEMDEVEGEEMKRRILRGGDGEGGGEWRRGSGMEKEEVEWRRWRRWRRKR